MNIHQINPETLLRQIINNNIVVCSNNSNLQQITRSSNIDINNLLVEYNYNFNHDKIDDLCEVIVSNTHICSIINKEYLINNKKILSMFKINKYFDGSNFQKSQGFDDDLLFNTKTNINSIIQYSNLYKYNIFPLSNKCLYYKNIAIIRDQQNNLIEHNNIVFDIIMIKEPDENNFDEYIRILKNIECLFQTAILNKYDTIILSSINNNYITNDDLIKIFNYCIYLYGHKFKKIYISVLNNEYTQYKQQIINPIY